MYAIFHSFIISITTIYYAHIYYLTPLILFTPLLFYFIAYIPAMRSIVYNSYARSHLVIVIIIIIQPPPVYITPTYLRYNITLLIPITTLAPLIHVYKSDSHSFPTTWSDDNLSHCQRNKCIHIRYPLPR